MNVFKSVLGYKMKDLDIIICSTLYICDLNIYVHLYDDCIKIIDLKNAMKRGKECDCYCIHFKDYYKNNDFKNQFKSFLSSWSFEEFWEILRTELDFYLLEIRKSQRKGIDVFSPFVNKPIKKPKRRWTTLHIAKAILSNQIKEIVCKRKLTDDYKYDSDNDFGKGVVDKLVFAKKLVEDSRGWRISTREEGGECILSIDCYHFDSNQALFE